MASSKIDNGSPSPATAETSLDHPGHANHVFHMKLALAEAEKCIPTETAFSVGAVLVDPSQTPYHILATGYSRELPGNTHAEQVCLEKLHQLERDGRMLDPNPGSGFFLYTTMEPCTERLSGNQSCVDRLIHFGRVSTIYIGCREPSTFVHENYAASKLDTAGILYVSVPGLDQACYEVAIKGHTLSS